MALDGITIAAIAHELKTKLVGGRIDKIHQPEKDEIVVSARSQGANHKILLTANASNPRIHFTKTFKDNPMQAPLFCMVLRKHLSGARITGVSQPDFERILEIRAESLNELGDLSEKILIIEIMGKHSNIILTDENGMILDSVKRVSADVSSVREVMPGKKYSTPPNRGKRDPLAADEKSFLETLNEVAEGTQIHKAIYEKYSGISPVAACEICFRSEINPSDALSTVDVRNREKLFGCFKKLTDDISGGNFQYEAIYDEKGFLFEFAAINLTQFGGFKKETFDTPSEMLESYYAQRDAKYHILQKSSDLRKSVTTNIERLVKKLDIQQKTLKETENRGKWKLYGELLTANIYAVKKGSENFTTINFYDDNSEITIPLDQRKTPSENAQKYFAKYNKEKRAFDAMLEQTAQTKEELSYLEGVLNAVLAASDEADLDEIRGELSEQGFVKKKRENKKNAGKQNKKSKPMGYVSSDGFEIFVGKSNTQNDELTLRFAAADDIWLHTKEIPGSHVIIKTDGKTPPDSTIAEAAMLAAFFSKAKASSLVPVDYAKRRNVKKPNGARPGMVIYDNYKTAFITPDESKVNGLKKLTE